MNAVVRAGERLPAPTAESASLLEIISRAASDPSVDIDKMERLLQMKERLDARDAEAQFNAALCAAQSETGRVAADADNPQTRSKYATYAKIDKILRPIYTRHGLALSFDETDSPKQDHIRVLCHVTHSAGHKMTYQKDMPADGKGAKGGDVMTKTHAAGAAQSYGRRYLVLGIFNVAIGEEDRDGNSTIARVSDQQAANIEALLTEVGGDKKRFLAYLKADSIADIPAANYATVIREIEAKRARQ
jgi:hypothetical protein